MSKAWRIVLFIVLGLLAAGVVLAGAGWLTGASLVRIEELVLGGKGGLQTWLQTGVDRVLAFLTGLPERIVNIF